MFIYISFLTTIYLSLNICGFTSGESVLPLVINTWPFTNATQKAWDVVNSNAGSALDAVEQGCSVCELIDQCGRSVGYGNHPDESCETTLDAMIMDGVTHDVGSVGGLRRIKSAISVARAVMKYTKHTLLVGDAATNFAIEMGFKEESLSTNASIKMCNEWKNNDCQPNFRQNVYNQSTCGPYKPIPDQAAKSQRKQVRYNKDVSKTNHDTIGMIVVDQNGNVAGGTTTNGANHKVPGRVGDSPIAGSGSYVDNDVGGAAATGDGDVMMRFLPSYQAVESMRQGMKPSKACAEVLARIVKKYPDFSGALIAADNKGNYGAACHNFGTFHYSLQNPQMASVKVAQVACTQTHR